jgi:hypothetical protein
VTAFYLKKDDMVEADRWLLLADFTNSTTFRLGQ